MTTLAKGRRGVEKTSKTCAATFWKVFPHLTLCGTLVLYATLGALIFQLIEGRSASSHEEEYNTFLERVVEEVQRDTNTGCNTTTIVENVKGRMENFSLVWLQSPSRWTFAESLFFCCTVFTTVGYGEIYPVTLTGKVVCVIYASVGIPLMLLVILDVGDFLALVMSRAYSKFHKLCKAFRSYTWPPRKSWKREADSDFQNLEGDGFALGQDIVICKPLDIRQVMHSQADVRNKSIRLQKNKGIFEKIIAREDLVRKSPLLRSISCPELERPYKFPIWDFSGLGDGMETLDVPFLLILFVVTLYICLGANVLTMWEKSFLGFDSYYFCFITLTTIGFGDIIPKHREYFMLISLFIIIGMAIMSMAFKLSQTRIVSVYRKCIQFISRGNAEKFDTEKNN
ncbi:potassium channel subfamily K member 18 [Austrofundulus limnaeus]|uniref:Potassium channel subfamily K member 18 n=1 Tax=Austrofundulus limnaeus TaxID=52670 RepID=A0A2I4AS67_AUSLI|nr:PREDICTED: potassium channel subfamily K member 18 [Austrofundulus limnaeus]